jgi:hypothetical protein
VKIRKLLILASLATQQAGAAFIISQPNEPTSQGNAGTGQSFTPSVGMVDNPGPSTATIDLTAFSLWSSGGASVTTGRNTTYLLIYDANPSGAANLVGSSTNFIDLDPISNAPAGTQLTWTFNNLTLNYTTTYFAVISSSNSGTTVNDIGVGFRNSTLNPYAGGNALADNFAVQGTGDLKFSATFANPMAIPEPAAVLLGGIGMLTLLSRRRGRAVAGFTGS